MESSGVEDPTLLRGAMESSGAEERMRRAVLRLGLCVCPEAASEAHQEQGVRRAATRDTGGVARLSSSQMKKKHEWIYMGDYPPLPS